MRNRVERIEKNLKRILMDYFLTKSAHAYPGIISVKEINVQSDLKKANVYISVMGTKKDVQQTRLKLEEDRFDMRSLVNHRLRIKYCPYFNFFVNHISIPLTSVEETLVSLREKDEV